MLKLQTFFTFSITATRTSVVYEVHINCNRMYSVPQRAMLDNNGRASEKKMIEKKRRKRCNSSSRCGSNNKLKLEKQRTHRMMYGFFVANTIKLSTYFSYPLTKTTASITCTAATAGNEHRTSVSLASCVCHKHLRNMVNKKTYFGANAIETRFPHSHTRGPRGVRECVMCIMNGMEGLCDMKERRRASQPKKAEEKNSKSSQ